MAGADEDRCQMEDGPMRTTALASGLLVALLVGTPASSWADAIIGLACQPSVPPGERARAAPESDVVIWRVSRPPWGLYASCPSHVILSRLPDATDVTTPRPPEVRSAGAGRTSRGVR
jgi:hypothetical protein